MDEPLRNGLWSLLKVHIWDDVAYTNDGMFGGYYLSASGNSEIRKLCERLWFEFYKRPLDELVSDWTKVLEFLRQYFFKVEWYDVYDFIEFVFNNYRKARFQERFAPACNAVLEKEMSAYRLVGGSFTRITEREQLSEVQTALDRASGPVRTHLRRALELLSDRGSPDYRNSIKESISAVEALVAETTGERGPLGQLIKRLEDKIGLHPALKAGFSNLYGYTSDEGGIRHALLESKKLTFEDAAFFMVICSAFVNFVEAKVEVGR